jgi:methylated-DNA-[protein]-cysteine S-methyltransferase
MTIRTAIASPIGDLVLTGDGDSLTSLSVAPATGVARHRDAFTPIVRQLDAYFAGELTRFDIPFARSGTDFQERV